MWLFSWYESVKENFLKYKYLSWNKDYSNKLDEKLNKQFKNTFKFSDNDINKFILLLRKGVYPYEYMDNWENFNETTLPEKEEFTDADYLHSERLCKDFEIRNLGEYHDFYLKSDALLLTDVFENVRRMCLKIYHLYPVKLLSSPGWEWQGALKKAEVKLELWTDIDMLLMVEKGIREGICHAIHWYAKADNKYMKDYDKNKESSTAWKTPFS